MIKKRIAIFASGSGSNALNLVNYFSNNDGIEVGIILSNKKEAPVVSACEKLGLDVFVLSNAEVSEGQRLIDICQNQGIDFIVLAGYLRKIPVELIQEYPNEIINLHPSLLPKYGGEGMYGKHVHAAVLEAGDKETGISVHVVNAEYDKGQMLAQFYTPLAKEDNTSTILDKIKLLESTYFPMVVEKYISTLHA